MELQVWQPVLIIVELYCFSEDSENQNHRTGDPTGSLEGPSQELNFVIHLGVGGISTVKLKNLFGSWDLPCLLVLFNFLKLLTAKNTEEKLLYKYAVLKQLSEEKIFPFQDHGVVSEQLGFFVLFRRNVRKALTLDSRWPKPKLCFIRSSWGIPRRLIFVCFLFFRISVQARRLSPL